MTRNEKTPSVSAAERRRKADRKRVQRRDPGRDIEPVEVQGRNIAQTFWGKAWCQNLETYSDYANRLPRGRTYARNGSILDLQIVEGRINALVSGSQLYDVIIQIETLSDERWSVIREDCAGQIDSLVELLQGRVSTGVMEVVTRAEDGLFPSPREIHLYCSCPDWATMCKHVAAVLYGVGNRLDHAPEMLFSLRGVDPNAMVVQAIELGVGSPRVARGRVLDVDDLSSVFGVDIDFGDQGPATRKKKPDQPKKPQNRLPPAPRGELPARAQQVLDVISSHPGLRTPQIAERIGVSRSTVSSTIARLKTEGSVVFVGPPKHGGYHCTVKKTVTPAEPEHRHATRSVPPVTQGPSTGQPLPVEHQIEKSDISTARSLSNWISRRLARVIERL